MIKERHSNDVLTPFAGWNSWCKFGLWWRSNLCVVKQNIACHFQWSSTKIISSDWYRGWSTRPWWRSTLWCRGWRV